MYEWEKYDFFIMWYGVYFPLLFTSHDIIMVNFLNFSLSRCNKNHFSSKKFKQWHIMCLYVFNFPLQPYTIHKNNLTNPPIPLSQPFQNHCQPLNACTITLCIWPQGADNLAQSLLFVFVHACSLYIMHLQREDTKLS